MPRFGAHLSVAPFRPPAWQRPGRGRTSAVVSGPRAALERARELGCDCVQLFLRPNRQWRARRQPTDAEAAAFRRAAREPLSPEAKEREGGAEEEDAQSRPNPSASSLLDPIVSHASYLINLAGPPGRRATGGAGGQSRVRRDVRRRSIEALKDEICRADRLGVPWVVLHPGSHMGDGEEAGLRRAVEALDEVLEATSQSAVKILLETTAGQGTGVGYRLEHLAEMLERVVRSDRLGICCDTCHMFAAGYDFRDEVAYEKTMRAVDSTVGLGCVRLWHLNDSANSLGSRVDRHAHIGQGHIGLDGFRRLVTDDRFRDHPMILETPKKGPDGRDMYPVNLAALRRLAGET